MIFAPDHARLLEIALPVCDLHGLALAGGYAVRAHGVVDRPSKDLDLVTGASTPIGEITAALDDAYRRAGLEVALGRGTALTATLRVTLPHGATHRVCVMKQPLSRPPVRMDAGLERQVPVASLEDMAAMKLVALADRSVACDLIDVHGMTSYFTQGELLATARAFDEDFRPRALTDRLDKLAGLDDWEFARHGLDDDQVRALKRWALDWAADIELDLMEGLEHPDTLYDPGYDPVTEEPDEV